VTRITDAGCCRRLDWPSVGLTRSCDREDTMVGTTESVVVEPDPDTFVIDPMASEEETAVAADDQP
jgi:hypothetical protein